MIKVMIVEDEPPILRDIKLLIESTNTQFKVIASASNGHQAIDILENETPDVIFTDIQMPVVDGFELISHIKGKELDIIPVILSGYSEFAYAKKAIALGVEDYLLKPVNEEELKDLLHKIETKLKYKKVELRKKFFSNLIENDTLEGFPKDVISSNSTYLIILLCAGPFPTYTIDYYSPIRDLWKKFDFEKKAEDILYNGDSVWVIDGKTASEKVMIFTLSETSSKKVDYLIEKISSVLSSLSFSVTLAVSGLINKVDEIGQTLLNLRSLLNKKIVIGSSQVLKLDVPDENKWNSTKDIPCIDSSFENKLVHALQQGNIQSFKADIKKLFNHWKSSAYPQIWVEKLLRDIVFICMRSLPESTDYTAADLGLEINEAISMSSDYEELFRNIWYVFDSLFDIRVQNSTDRDSILILMQKVDKYISTNLAQPINNQVLSDIFGLVPSYLSKLFREYKGMSPSDYLVNLRIEKAKELLQSKSDLLTKDIAEIIGYSDPLYFSKIFKKETGLSPSEYKRNFIHKL